MVAFVLVSAAVGFLNTLKQHCRADSLPRRGFLTVFDKPQRDALGMLFVRLHSRGILITRSFGVVAVPFGLLVFAPVFCRGSSCQAHDQTV